MSNKPRKKKKISPREHTRRLMQAFMSRGGMGADAKGNPVWYDYKTGEKIDVIQQEGESDVSDTV